MDEQPKTGVGRPKGTSVYPVLKQIRLRVEDGQDLKDLAAFWRCTEAEAMRRCVREVARRVKTEGAE